MEKRIPEPKKVHEINIAIPVGIYNSPDAAYRQTKSDWKIIYFWNMDLLNDSFYIKKQFYISEKPDSVSFMAGKFSFKENPKISRFIKMANSINNGQMFIHEFNEGEFYCYPLHIFQYKKNSSSKVFFFDDRNPVLRDLTDLVYSLDSLKNQKPISSATNIKEEELYNQVNKIPAFKTLNLPPHMVRKTIRFTPPVKEN